jgi:hypothetical protein
LGARTDPDHWRPNPGSRVSGGGADRRPLDRRRDIPIYVAVTIFIGHTDIFECPRCHASVSVTMGILGPAFATPDEQSICPEITERYLLHSAGSKPFSDLALCEPLRREVALHHPS